MKADIDLLIKKLFQKEKTVKEADMLHPRTANNASKIISALCELNGLDITQPYGNSNKEIMGVLDRLGTPLSKDVVGDWLSQLMKIQNINSNQVTTKSKHKDYELNNLTN